MNFPTADDVTPLCLAGGGVSNNSLSVVDCTIAWLEVGENSADRGNKEAVVASFVVGEASLDGEYTKAFEISDDVAILPFVMDDSSSAIEIEMPIVSVLVSYSKELITEDSIGITEDTNSRKEWRGLGEANGV